MIVSIWNSFRRLPVWVQLWVVVVLVPVNAGTLAFVGDPRGGVVAALAVGAMVLNGPIILADRGFSKAMALPHLALWIPLVWIVADLVMPPQEVTGGYRGYLLGLLAVDMVSLAFDIPDALKWVRGDRDVA